MSSADGFPTKDLPKWAQSIKTQMSNAAQNPELSQSHSDQPRPEQLRPASVLIGISARAQGPSLILTRRRDDLKVHPGQIALPGGKQDPEDQDPWATAKREAWEEVGIDRAKLGLLGRLPVYNSGTGFAISPFVAHVPADVQTEAQESEVAEIFEVLLSQVLDPNNHKQQTKFLCGFHRQIYSIICHDGRGKAREIWGVTAGILVIFARHLSDRTAALSLD